MNYLLDTHLLIWAALSAARLSPQARALLENPAHSLHFSAASLWEITIKHALGRADFNIDPVRLHNGLRANGYVEVPVTAAHALGLLALPPLHKDPFDRLLLAQAFTDGLTLLTSDSTVSRYPGAIILV